MEPSLGPRPFATDGHGRDLQHGGRLVDAEAGEIAELHDARLAGVVSFERREGVAEGDEIDTGLLHERLRLIERDVDGPAATLVPRVSTGVVDEHAPHDAGADGEEMRAVLPRGGVTAGEAEEGLVHQRGRLQRMTRPLALHLPRRDATKLREHERREAVERGAIASGPVREQTRDLRLRGSGHEVDREIVAGGEHFWCALSLQEVKENLMNATNRRRILAAACCFGLTTSFLLNIFFGLMTRPRPLSAGTIALVGFLAVLNVGFMIGAVCGIVHLLREQADRLGLAGAALTLLGWTASARIMVLIQFQSLLEKGVKDVPENAVGKILESAPIVFVSIVPVGILFPLGLLTLGIALAAAQPLGRWPGVLLATGGVLFPVGRAVGVGAAILGADLVLAATFTLIGWRIVTRPAAWQIEPAPAPGDLSTGEMGPATAIQALP
jgi:hypothetical protein